MNSQKIVNRVMDMMGFSMAFMVIASAAGLLYAFERHLI